MFCNSFSTWVTREKCSSNWYRKEQTHSNELTVGTQALKEKLRCTVHSTSLFTATIWGPPASRPREYKENTPSLPLRLSSSGCSVYTVPSVQLWAPVTALRPTTVRAARGRVESCLLPPSRHPSTYYTPPLLVKLDVCFSRCAGGFWRTRRSLIALCLPLTGTVMGSQEMRRIS